jgi:cyclopropane fatty-acyl-phospholipid synthase-like methyltransferase
MEVTKDPNDLLATVQAAQKVVDLQQGNRVLDIGCGDGTLLGWYTIGIFTVGIDTDEKLLTEGLTSKRIDVGIFNSFSLINVLQPFAGLADIKVRFKIITIIDTLQELDQVQVLKDCKLLLDKEGVIVIETKYVLSDKKENTYSVIKLKSMVVDADLELQGIEIKSDKSILRSFITRKDNKTFGVGLSHTDKLWLTTNVDMKIIDEMRAGV